MIWNFSLQMVYATELAAIGRAGVALPRIPSFDFLFSDAVITLEDGYASIVTDVQHAKDPKRVVQRLSNLPVAAR